MVRACVFPSYTAPPQSRIFAYSNLEMEQEERPWRAEDTQALLSYHNMVVQKELGERAAL